MNTLYVGAGTVLLVFGAYSMLFPEGGWVRNWVSPQQWREDPEAAGEEQAEWAGFMGAFFFLFGCLLVIGGLLS